MKLLDFVVKVEVLKHNDYVYINFNCDIMNNKMFVFIQEIKVMHI